MNDSDGLLKYRKGNDDTIYLMHAAPKKQKKDTRRHGVKNVQSTSVAEKRIAMKLAAFAVNTTWSLRKSG
jgi:Icc-related predicted phosphoesterase